ncbi:hypothetical protein [Pyxidicoccus caerfyrddinensis]|uniref:hypothetical protein n=1 Tax=Pyxidicoccus caerfyrddinensis TaxID=2709663 RepID=UPI0013DBB4F6|nr:hypothetical protein [Pyxidicoccus caerfyrddinensis]
MHPGGFRRWLLLPGALAAVALLGTACERDKPLPKTGGEYEGVANEQQPLESFGPANQQPASQLGGKPATGSTPPPATGGSGTSSPREQPSTDQGGTRQFEEQGGPGNSTVQPGTEQGPRSPPKVDTEEPAPKE